MFSFSLFDHVRTWVSVEPNPYHLPKLRLHLVNKDETSATHMKPKLSMKDVSNPFGSKTMIFVSCSRLCGPFTRAYTHTHNTALHTAAMRSLPLHSCAAPATPSKRTHPSVWEGWLQGGVSTEAWLQGPGRRGVWVQVVGVGGERGGGLERGRGWGGGRGGCGGGGWEWSVGDAGCRMFCRARLVGCARRDGVE